MGAGYIKVCPKCKYEYHSSTGIGFLFPLVYSETVEKAKAGELGKELREFFEKHKDGAINAEYVDLCCKDCGNLFHGMDLTMYVPNEKKPEQEADYVMRYELNEYYIEYAKYPHKCEKCGGKARIMREGETMLCPECKVPLEITDIINWD